MWGFPSSNCPCVSGQSKFMRQTFCRPMGISWSQHRNNLLSSKNVSTACMITFYHIAINCISFFYLLRKKRQKTATETII